MKMRPFEIENDSDDVTLVVEAHGRLYEIKPGAKVVLKGRRSVSHKQGT